MTIHAASVETPIGGFALAATERGLCAVVPVGTVGADAGRSAPLREALRRQGRANTRIVSHASGEPMPSALRRGVEALVAYGAGSRASFAGPIDTGGTEFQRAVWKRLLAIGHGAASSYGEVARAIGAPKASRAVGAAVGANPIFILIPCHRVLGSDGALTGFGGGLPMKRALLAHEGWSFGPGAPRRNTRVRRAAGPGAVRR